jgi:hypothetical protein
MGLFDTLCVNGRGGLCDGEQITCAQTSISPSLRKAPDFSLENCALPFLDFAIGTL